MYIGTRKTKFLYHLSPLNTNRLIRSQSLEYYYGKM